MRFGISKLWGIFTGLLVIGIIIYIAVLYVTSQNITVEVESIKSVNYKPLNNIVETCFVLRVNNTGLIDVTIEKLYYRIYVDGEYLGEGTKENIIIEKGTNLIDICLNTSPDKIAKSVLVAAMGRGKVNVTVRGYIDVPIKSFGVIKLWTLELPIEKTMEVDLETR